MNKLWQCVNICIPNLCAVFDGEDIKVDWVTLFGCTSMNEREDLGFEMVMAFYTF